MPMKALNDARMYARFSLGLHKFLRKKITLEQAYSIVEKDLADRDRNFLRVIGLGVFGYANSPYLPLLRWAGCEFGDIEKLVRQDGLVTALRALREAGVYITFEEFKGRETIRRGSKEFPLRPSGFDNPYVKSCYVGESGGSTGAGTRVPHDLDYLASRAPRQMVGAHINGVLNMPWALWRTLLPCPSGINNLIMSSITGNPPIKWFTPLLREELKPSLKYSLANHYILNTIRLHGIRVPKPERVPLDRADTIVRWMERTLREEGGVYIAAGVSLSLRIAVAAREMGIDLSGAVLSAGGEAMTEAKAAVIRSSGARHRPLYHFAEAGLVGLPCNQPADCNDLHFLSDHLEVFQYPRQVPGTTVTVPAFNFTTLLPTAPKLLLNVEIDDYGDIEERNCGCELHKLGWTRHLTNIRSFRKLTGDGMTLIGSDIERILDKVLPERFGGCAQDYQLLEEEGEDGFTRRSLIVSPRIDLADESSLLHVVLDELGRGDAAADLARALLSQGKSLGVKRMEPVWTDRGKLLPLHILKHTSEQEKGQG